MKYIIVTNNLQHNLINTVTELINKNNYQITTYVKTTNNNYHMYNDTYTPTGSYEVIETITIQPNTIILTTINFAKFYEMNNVIPIILHTSTKLQHLQHLLKQLDNTTFLKNYTERTFIFDQHNTGQSINQIINQSNNLTLKINKFTKITKNTKNDEYNTRYILTKSILNYIDQMVEYFIIPHVYPIRKISASIAIVGNSKKSLRYTYGNDIDNHQNVIRFNYAITDGFEKHVGSKHDIRVGNAICITGNPYPNHPKGIVKDYKLYNKLRSTSIMIFTRQIRSASSIKNQSKLIGVNATDKTFNCIHWNINNFNNYLKYHKTKLTMDPQCGLGLMLLIISIGLIPDMYGFDMALGGDNYGYYWSGEVVHKKLSRFHKITIEHKLLKAFNDCDIIRIHE